MTNKQPATTARSNSAPSPALKRLGDKLVGTWRLTGGAEGTVRFEWLEGRHFLIQHVDLTVRGRQIKGIEVLGHLHRVNEPPSDEIWTRFYSFLDGLTLDYVYELDGNALTIWFMKKNSDNRFRGAFTADGTSYSGAWSWPGGGYKVAASRIS
ncbi:MAG TPA: hypothetical protein VFA27_13010 [Vicinamibacterales bacterium]|nr:hypothetical protein [Vicinamibacterales bacterium]